MVGDGPGKAVLGELQDVGHGGVGERVRRGDGNRARHVRHAVVGDAVDLVGRVRVGGGTRGLEAAALVDGDVDEDRVRLHQPELGARDHVRGTRAVHEHGADHQVDIGEPLLDRQGGGKARVGAAAEGDVELAQAIDVAVEHVHGRLHPQRDEGRIHPDDAAADDHYARGRHARDAAEEDAAAAEGLLEHERPRLGGDLSGHLGHGREQGQPAARVLDRLIGHAGRSRGRQRARE